MIVTVVYAMPDRSRVLQVEVQPGATIGEAIAISGLLDAEPALRDVTLDAGVWNHRRPLETPVHEGDRIEVYRPLKVEPKEARRIRAELRRRRGAKEG